MAKWTLPRWLVFVRALQIIATLVSAGLNGFLLVYIHINKLGLSNVMVTVEIMTSVMLVYIAVVLLLHQTGRRRGPQLSLITGFVLGDVIFTGITIGIISILARAGVPSNCGGLTRSDYTGDDAPNNPPANYTTIRFSNGDGDQKGVLDKYCSMERGYYFISVALIFFYMATVTLGVLRICEDRYMWPSNGRNNKDDELTMYHVASKSSETHLASSSSNAAQLRTPVSPVQEGIAVAAAATTIPPPPPPPTTRPQISPHGQARRSTLTAVSPLTASSSPAATIDPTREGLLLMQNQPYTQVLQHQPQYHPHGHHHHHQHPDDRLEDGEGGDDAETDNAEAQAAMVTDGYRHNQHQHQHQHQLPPYTPGESSRFMGGHAREDDEIRLGGYVVDGETRMRNAKSGGGL